MKSKNDFLDFDASTYLFKGCSKVNESDILTFRAFIKDELEWEGIEFQVWLWNRPKLIGIYLGMACKLGIIDSGKSLESLLELTLDITNLYLDNPYHNCGHGFDVAFMVYYMVQDLGVAHQLSLTKFELIALLIGALAHDMGHPGLNNIYQINSKSDLAQKYKNKSVLENYSIDLLYGLLDKNAYLNIVINDEEQINQVRNLMKVIILNTDMAYHFDIVNKLVALVEPQLLPVIEMHSTNGNVVEERLITDLDLQRSSHSVERSSSLAGSLSSSSEYPTSELDLINTDNLENRQVLISSILHAAARPFVVSKMWSKLVMHEFYLQGDKEKENNFPISPSMDRSITNETDVTTGFTNLIVLPFFDVLNVIFPRMDCFCLLLRTNLQSWQEAKAELSPFPEIKMEAILPNRPQLRNHIRKVSMPAGMIEGNEHQFSIAEKFMLKRKLSTFSQSRRETRILEK